MYPSMSRYHRTLISMLLLVSMNRAESVKMNTERRLADSSDPEALGSPVESPYWEYVLREFLFKTISPPPPANNILYKELLEAPFYSGPFPAPETFNDGETAQVLSRGDVYHLVNGGWIICQEGCKDCEICTVQKALIIPTVKWILRRIERYVQFPHSKRHDLQLTVLPQADGGFHMKNLSPGSYVYVTSNNGALADFSDTLIRKNKEYNSLRYPFGTTKSPGCKNPGDIFHRNEETDKELIDEAKVVTEKPIDGPETENEIFRTETQLKITSTSIPETQTVSVRKRGREVLQDGENRSRIDELEDNRRRDSEHSRPTENTTPLTLFYPPTDLPMVQKIDADCGTRKDTRLILGRDQFGDKHIVHVVPADDLDAEMKKTSVHPGVRFIHQKLAQPHPFETEYEDRPLYRKIFRRVIDSLNTHKNAIEKFLLSSKLESRLGHGPSSTSTASTFHKEENAVLNHDDDNSTQTSSAEPHIDNSKGTNDTVNDLESATDEEMVEETSSASTTTDIPNEEDEDPTGSHRSTVQVTEDEVQESNNDLHNFDDQNSTRSLSDESTKRHNNSGTLILKEVAKSVLNHSDTLQGFNPVSNSSIRRDNLRSISDGSTGRTEYLNRRDKSRRHV